MKLRHSAISSPQPGAPFGSPLCLWVVRFLRVRINGGTVVGSDCWLEDITPNEQVHALAGAGADDDEAAGGRATSGARGSDDEVADCATSGAGGSNNEVAEGCAVSGADGSDDEAVEGCAASGVEGGGWDVVSYPYFSQSQLRSNLGPPDLSLGIDATPDLVRPSPAP